jgi:serine/threonine protein kinase
MIVMEYAAGGTLHDYLESKSMSFGGGGENEEEDYIDYEAEIANLFAQIVLPLNLVHVRFSKAAKQ